MKILTFGEIIWDVYPEKKCLGGAPLNFAAHAHRAGAEAYLLSAVGNDELGHRALSLAEKYGVKTDYVSVLDNYKTGQCTVTLSKDGVPSYEILCDVAYDKIPLAKGAEMEGFCALNFGTLALRGKENRLVLKELIDKNNFNEIFVDLNLRAPFYSRESIIFGLENATLLKVSDEELPFVMNTVFGMDILGDEALMKLAESYGNIKLIVLTCGGEGSMVYDTGNNEVHKCEATKTKVVSTVGAGDSYGATFLANYLAGENIDACLKKASQVSAFVVSKSEAIPEI